ncbi:MAG: hypothetical protein QOF71_2739 [Candidatus Eremiobacteraeota bacterium]|jgi:hypothetical protein|nr:hypothetical protein [Candidatus Eremiobacteraeota bacterium]
MGKDSSEIRREIEQTRARMGDTVEALGYKADVPSRVKDAVHDKVDTVKGTIGGVVGGVKDALTGATGKVGDVTSSLTSNVTDGVGGIADKLPSGADVKNVARRGAGIVAENPLGLALGAVAVGFLAGLLTPVTNYEREKVGPIRDDLLERAQSVGTDVLEHGKQVLQETVQSAVQTAQQSAQTHSQQIVSEAAGSTQHGQNSSSRYGVMLDDAEVDTLEPGTPGTASP